MNFYLIKKFYEIVDKFLDFISNKKIIIHNAEFDISHLNNELSLIGRPKINKENIIDTLDIARNKFQDLVLALMHYVNVLGSITQKRKTQH